MEDMGQAAGSACFHGERKEEQGCEKSVCLEEEHPNTQTQDTQWEEVRLLVSKHVPAYRDHMRGGSKILPPNLP